MIIERREDMVVFRDLHPFLEELFLQIPESAEPSDDASRARLFGDLTGGRDREADAEWREINEPELHELFKSHTDTVAGDLKHFTGEGEERELAFPVEHLPAWVHTLNQARLAIAARYGFIEAEIEGEILIEDPQKYAALRQIEIYAMLLSFLLRHTEL